MGTGAALPWPQRTTAFGGAAIAVGALLVLLTRADLVIAVAEPIPVPLSGPGFTIAADTVLLLGALVLAVGAPGETGVAGTSRIGRIALIAGGAQPLALVLLELLPVSMPAAAWISLVVLVGGAAAAVVGAIAVVRARVLLGAARWALLPSAVVLLLLALLGVAPLPEAQAFAEPMGTAWALLLLAAGIVLLVDGRIEALRHRVDRIRREW